MCAGAMRDMLVDSGMGVVSLRAWVPLVSERPAGRGRQPHPFRPYRLPSRISLPPVPRRRGRYPGRTHPRRHRGRPYVTADTIFDALPPEPYHSAHLYRGGRPRDAAPARWRYRIDLGDRHFEVIHTPGHSPGGIALWEAASGVLISGDILYDGPLIEDTYHADPAHYIASMQRLYDLPVRVVHAGHFPSYGGDRHRQIIGDWLRAKGV
jgi:glyoxylase-like metal-dependent hydrolase (beta-lactamase superfamily II)